ncbi:MAG: hypothetical protein ACLR6O_02260 [Eubacterium sp.]
METNLTKSIYSNSDKMLMDIKDLYAECSQAKDALRLPIEQMNLGSTYKFITNQTTHHISQTKSLQANNQHRRTPKP